MGLPVQASPLEARQQQLHRNLHQNTSVLLVGYLDICITVGGSVTIIRGTEIKCLEGEKVLLQTLVSHKERR